MSEELASDRVEKWLASVENLPGWEGNSIGHETAVQELQEQGLTRKDAEERLAELRYFGWLDMVPLPDGRRILATPKLMERVLRRETRKPTVLQQPTITTPNWDRERLILYWRGDEIKRLRSRTVARNQAAVLDTFQDDGWPGRIDSPIRPKPRMEPKRQMHETIDGLNNKLTGIKFRADGSGKGIVWEPTDSPPSPSSQD